MDRDPPKGFDCRTIGIAGSRAFTLRMSNTISQLGATNAGSVDFTVDCVIAEKCDDHPFVAAALADGVPIVNEAWVEHCYESGVFVAPAVPYRLDLGIQHRPSVSSFDCCSGPGSPSNADLPAAAAAPSAAAVAAMEVPESMTKAPFHGTVSASAASDSTLAKYDVSSNTLERHVVLQCCDLKDNKNKFYVLELHRDAQRKDGFVLLSHYGRTDDLLKGDPRAQGRRDERKFASRELGNKEFESLLAQKIKIKKYEPVKLTSCNVGSLQLGRFYEHQDQTQQTTTTEFIQTSSRSFDEGAVNLVGTLYREAETVLSRQIIAKVTSKGVETPLGALSVEQIEAGETVLDEIAGRMENAKACFDLSSKFYSLVPHYLGGRSRDTVSQAVITTMAALQAKRDTLQLARDMIRASELAQAVGGGMSEEKMRLVALGCDVAAVQQHTGEFATVQGIIDKESNRVKCHVKNVYRVARPEEKPARDGLQQAEPSSKKMLIHGSRASNWYGILQRGLLLPKSHDAFGVRRTNVGWLGSGIYFADAACTTTRYATRASNGSFFAAVLSVRLGRPFETTRIDSTLVSPPAGFDSVYAHGAEQDGPPASDFADNEFCVYDGDRHSFDYLVEFDAERQLPPPADKAAKPAVGATAVPPPAATPAPVAAAVPPFAAAPRTAAVARKTTKAVAAAPRHADPASLFQSVPPAGFAPAAPAAPVAVPAPSAPYKMRVTAPAAAGFPAPAAPFAAAPKAPVAMPAPSGPFKMPAKQPATKMRVVGRAPRSAPVAAKKTLSRAPPPPTVMPVRKAPGMLTAAPTATSTMTFNNTEWGKLPHEQRPQRQDRVMTTLQTCPDVNSDAENRFIADADRFMRTAYASDTTDPGLLADRTLGLVDVTADHATFVRSGLTAAEAAIPRVLDQHVRFPEAGGPSVNDPAAFGSAWSEFSAGQLDGLDWSNVFVAGGCVLACLLRPEDQVAKEFRGADIDLFLYGLSDEEGEAKVRHILEVVTRNRQSAEPVVPLRTAHAVTITGMYPYRHVQIVLRMYRSPAEVLHGFDVDSCSVGFNGASAFTTYRARRSLNKRVNFVDMTRRSLTYEARLHKYSKRGFAVAVPNLRPEFVDPAVRQGQGAAQKPQGLARLLFIDEKERAAMEARLRAAAHGGPAFASTAFNSRSKAARRTGARRVSQRQLRQQRREEAGYEIGSRGRVRRADWSGKLEVGNPDSSDYSLLLPYGPAWRPWALAAMLTRKDKAQLFSSGVHKHIAVSGITGTFNGRPDWCAQCRDNIPVQEAPGTVQGHITFLRVNPGTQLMTGSFHPVDDDKYEDGVYTTQAATPPMRYTVGGLVLLPVVTSAVDMPVYAPPGTPQPGAFGLGAPAASRARAARFAAPPRPAMAFAGAKAPAMPTAMPAMPAMPAPMPVAPARQPVPKLKTAAKMKAPKTTTKKSTVKLPHSVVDVAAEVRAMMTPAFSWDQHVTVIAAEALGHIPQVITPGTTIDLPPNVQSTLREVNGAVIVVLAADGQVTPFPVRVAYLASILQVITNVAIVCPISEGHSLPGMVFDVLAHVAVDRGVPIPTATTLFAPIHRAGEAAALPQCTFRAMLNGNFISATAKALSVPAVGIQQDRSIARDTREVLFLVGKPCTGKTTYARRHLTPRGYVLVHESTEGRAGRMLSALVSGSSVTVETDTGVPMDLVKLAERVPNVALRMALFDGPSGKLALMREELTGEPCAQRVHSMLVTRPPLHFPQLPMTLVPHQPEFETERERAVYLSVTTE